MADPPQLPLQISDKLYYRIGEVSRIAGVPASALRFWESQFTGIRPKRTLSGHRLYRQSDLDLILQIKQLLYERKFTIEGARYHLKGGQTAPAASQNRNELIQAVRMELEQIRQLLD